MSLFLQINVPRGILSIEQHESLSDIDVKEFYMKNFLIQYAVCALAVALMVPLAGAQSQPAGLQAPSLSLEARAQDERQYTEGPVTFVQEIAVEYGHFEEYIDWLNSTWKPTMEATRKAGIIIDYRVFSATPQSPDRPSIILWITYKNMAALDRGVEEKEIAKKVIGSTEFQNKARVARNEYRKVLRREYIRELILK